MSTNEELRAENAALRKALRDVCERGFEDDPCWCDENWHARFPTQHPPYCEAARQLLKGVA